MLKKSFILGMSLLMVACSSGNGAELEKNVLRVKKECQCRSCDLRGAQLVGFAPGSQLKSKNPFYVNNSGEDGSDYIRDSKGIECDFTDADLTTANLSKTNFTITMRGYVTAISKADFTRANLSQANLSEAILYGATFDYANLTSANLREVNLSLAKFKEASFKWANLVSALSRRDVMHGWGADFSKADFSHANLTNADLYGKFVGANFSHAKLTNAKLSSALDVITVPNNLTDQDLWKGVNFTEADLSGATFMNSQMNKPANISKAIFCHTVMPNGKINSRDCKK